MSYEYRFCFTGFLALEGFINCCLDAMVRLRSADNAFGAGKCYARLEGTKLVFRAGFNAPSVVQMAYNGCHPVVSQPAGVDRRWNKAVPEGVHLNQWSKHG